MIPKFKVVVQTPLFMQPRERVITVRGCELRSAIRAAKTAASRDWHIRRTLLVAPFIYRSTPHD